MSYTVIQMSYTENDIIWYDHIIVTEEINFLLHPKTFGWGIFGCIFSPCRRIKWIFRNCKMNFQSQTITSRVTWARHFENACFETTVQHETLFISMCIFCLQIYIYYEKLILYLCIKISNSHAERRNIVSSGVQTLFVIKCVYIKLTASIFIDCINSGWERNLPALFVPGNVWYKMLLKTMKNGNPHRFLSKGDTGYLDQTWFLIWLDFEGWCEFIGFKLVY